MSSKLIHFVAVIAMSYVSVNSETIYFLLGAEPYRYPDEMKKLIGTAVIPLSDPEHIAHARDLIRRGPSPNGESNRPTVSLLVRAGKNGINRNFYEPGSPEYSWHPYLVRRFADIVLQPVDTTPKRLETTVDWSDPAAWNEDRLVAFSDLTVVRELGPNPVFLSVNESASDLQFSWNVPNTNALSFTLETKTTVTGNAWSAVPGQWPSVTNSWTMPKTATAGFYRIRLHVDN